MPRPWTLAVYILFSKIKATHIAAKLAQQTVKLAGSKDQIAKKHLFIPPVGR